MSQQMLEIGTDKIQRLHAQAADRRQTRHARRAKWTGLVRWLGFVFA